MADDILNSPITTTPIPTATATPTPPAPPTSATPESWLSSINDPELLGHVQNRGWHTKPAAEAAIEAIRAHRAAEKMLGAPADQILRLPRPDDAEGTKAFWARLGASDKPEDFTFEGVEFDDPEWQSGFTDLMRRTAIDNHIPREMAERMAKQMFQFAADQGAKREAASTAQLQADQQELVREWGDPATARHKAAMFVADRAIDALGVTPEVQQKMAEAMGRVQVAKLFHRIGTAMQEDRFVSGNAPAGSSGVMTREQAVARRAELVGDKDFRDRWDRGDQSSRKELDALMRIISGV